MTPDRRPVLAVLTAAGAELPAQLDRPVQLDRIASRFEIRVTEANGLPAALGGADVLLLWDFFSSALRDAWPSADRLKWVHVAAAGVDRLLFEELIESDVVVTNAHGVFDRPIAEFVLGSILAFAKDLYTSHDHQLAHVWQHRETLMIKSRTVLVVGTGGVGRGIGRLLRAVGMEVRGVGRSARAGDPDFDSVVASSELDQQVGWADHVVVAAPLTGETRGLISAQVLAAMRSGSQLINIGRGPIVDEGALVEALDKGWLAAAALDVFCSEPLPVDHPLWSARGVALTPHMSGDVVGWRDTLAEQFVDNALRWLEDRSLINVVDKSRGYVPSRASSAKSPSPSVAGKDL